MNDNDETTRRVWVPEIADPGDLTEAEIAAGAKLLASTYVSAEDAGRALQGMLQKFPTMADLVTVQEKYLSDSAAELKLRQDLAAWLDIDVDRVQPGSLPRDIGPALPAYRILPALPRRRNLLRRLRNAFRGRV